MGIMNKIKSMLGYNDETKCCKVIEKPDGGKHYIRKTKSNLKDIKDGYGGED